MQSEATLHDPKADSFFVRKPCGFQWFFVKKLIFEEIPKKLQKAHVFLRKTPFFIDILMGPEIHHFGWFGCPFGANGWDPSGHCLG